MNTSRSVVDLIVRDIKSSQKEAISRRFARLGAGCSLKKVVVGLTQKGVKVEAVLVYLSGLQLWTLVTMSGEISSVALDEVRRRSPEDLGNGDRKQIKQKVCLLDPGLQREFRQWWLPKGAPVAI